MNIKTNKITLSKTEDKFREAYYYFRNHALFAPAITFFSSHFLFIATATVAQITVARLIGVDNMGLYRLALLIEGYTAFLFFGLSEGFARQLPFFLGRKEHSKVINITDFLWAWTSFVSFLRTVFYIGYAFYMIKKLGSFHILEVCLVLAFSSLLTKRKTIIDLIYRSYSEYSYISKIKNYESFYLLVSLSFLLIHPWYGFLFRWLLREIIVYIFLIKKSPVKPKHRMNTQYVFDLLKVGLPLFGAWYISILTLTINKSIVFFYFKEHGLGIFSISLLVVSNLSFVTQNVMKFFSPRMKNIFGKTNDPRAIIKSFIFPTIFLSVTFIPILGAIYIVLKPFVDFFLPEYSEGVFAAKIVLIAIYFKTINLTQMIYSTLDKGSVLFFIRLFSAISMIISMIAAKKFFNVGVEIGSLGLVVEAIVGFGLGFPIGLYYICKSPKKKLMV